MYPTKDLLQEVKNVLRRRKKLLIITPVLFILLSWGALQLIKPTYESSISILVQSEESVNPMMLYEMSGRSPSQNQLQSFNKIIYSRSSMEMLIDSLGLDDEIESKKQQQSLVEGLRNQISTTSESSESFEITFSATDPVRARDGAELLANYFIETRQQLENNRNSETVAFFQSKLKELENSVDKHQESIMNSTTDNMEGQAMNQEALQKRLESIDENINDLDWQIIQEENKLNIIEDFLEQGENISVTPLYKLPTDEIPLGEELNELLGEHDQMNEQYTESYPQLKSLKQQIIKLAERIPPAIESKLENLRELREEERQKRQQVINDMEQTFVATQQNDRQESSLNVYKELYSDIQVKLEQAQMSQEVGGKASEQFVVLDPAYIPQRASSPNKRFIVGAGFLIGIIIGGLLMGIAEMLDTTIRREEDLKFKKPVIAYLSDGRI